MPIKSIASNWLISWVLVVCLVVPTTAFAKEIHLKTDAPKRYEVQEGDSLWKIAGLFLADPWMWPQLWQNNPNITNPDVIYPGDVIELLHLQKSLVITPKKSARLLSQPVPELPLPILNNYLNQSRVVERDGLDSGLYVIELGKNGEGKTLAGQGDFITAVGELNPEVTRYAIFRQTETLRDPVNKRLLGNLALALGQAEVRVFSGRLAELEIIASNTEIKEGDMLLPFAYLNTDKQPQPYVPSRYLEGQILQNLNQASHFAGEQPLIINLGAHQVEAGALFEVIEPGKRYRNVETGEAIFANDKRKGLIMVYQTFTKTSLAIILESQQSLSPGDFLRPARQSNAQH